MSISHTPTPAMAAPVVDQDLEEQAKPGYGIPSQDPRPAAQAKLSPAEAEREAHSVAMGGGVMVGAAAGAAVGVAVAGPVGVVVGGAVGGVAGALGGLAGGGGQAVGVGAFGGLRVGGAGHDPASPESRRTGSGDVGSGSSPGCR
ncbi:hypothetical protein [Hydrogenophaga sp.]|uniref:hypothetical protein n=1 Tax=Hydrogenophaga sp. TaxID=1904254 RepID=UPI002638C752|nr:hypothetical protein [Hydrogenophaga sp.]